MVNFILAIFSIMLTAATVISTMNYLPGGAKVTAEAYNVSKTGIVTLEKAFKKYMSVNGAVYPPQTLAADGGLSQYFASYYGYLPKATTGYAWKYGYNGANYYICMSPATGNSGATYPLWRGWTRTRNVLSDQQYFILSSCGATPPATPQSAAAKAAPASFPAPLALVYTLRYP